MGGDYRSMARRDQPYLPLYVKDFLSDEKLNLCGAESTGVYIRLMCIMHMSTEYGKILLKQKYKQNDKQIFNFASQLANQMPYSEDTIERSLTELLDENVIGIDGDCLFQKRMVKDGKLSDTRALAGQKGGSKKTNSHDFASGFASGFANAKTQANSEYANEYVNESNNDTDSNNLQENVETTPRVRTEVLSDRFDEFWSAYPKKVKKIKAREAWMKIKPSAALHQKILAAVEAAKNSRQWKKDNGDFIPHPTSWLNQGRWEDELPTDGSSEETNNPFLQRLRDRGEA